MAGQCLRCKAAETGKPETISFDYLGVCFSVCKTGLYCRCCAREEAISKFEANLGNIYAVKAGEIVVDWDAFHGLEAIEGQEYRFDRVCETLVESQVLVFGAGWILVSETIILAPVLAGMRLSFRRKKDAEAYKKIRFGKTLYPVQLFFISSP